MHVMVAFGYDDGGVYLSDPGAGEYKYYTWGDFRWMWNVMDGMALGVSQ
jgi:predicted double-glycine peptidase